MPLCMFLPLCLSRLPVLSCHCLALYRHHALHPCFSRNSSLWEDDGRTGGGRGYPGKVGARDGPYHAGGGRQLLCRGRSVPGTRALGHPRGRATHVHFYDGYPVPPQEVKYTDLQLEEYGTVARGVLLRSGQQTTKCKKLGVCRKREWTTARIG